MKSRGSVIAGAVAAALGVFQAAGAKTFLRPCVHEDGSAAVCAGAGEWLFWLGIGLAAAVTLLLAILARGSSSEAVRSEVVCWAIDVAGCAGMILAYVLCSRFGEQMPWLTRYADSLIAVLLSVPALIGVLRMLRDNLAVCSIPRIKHDFS